MAIKISNVLLCGILTLSTLPAWAADDSVCVAEDTQPDTRIAACSSAIEKGQASGVALGALYAGRGIGWYGKHDADRAMADLSKAVELDPKQDKALGLRGLIYAEKGNYDQAIADGTAALAIDPSFAVVLLNRGRAYQLKNDPDRAIADFDAVLKIVPNEAKAYFWRGNSHMAKKENEPAIADFTNTIRLDPKIADGWYNRGLALEATGHPAEALADIRKYRELVNDADGPAVMARLEAKLKAAAAPSTTNAEAPRIIAAIHWPGKKAQFLFSNGTYLRYDLSADKADAGYPQKITDQSWPGLSGLASKIVAGFDGPGGKTWFFLSDGTFVDYGDKASSPMPIDDVNWPGLAPYATSIVSVVEGPKAALYFILKNGQYIRYNLAARTIDAGYPRALTEKNWPGLVGRVPMISALLTNLTGEKTWAFFKNGEYSRLTTAKGTADEGYPKPIDDESWPGMSAALGK